MAEREIRVAWSDEEEKEYLEFTGTIVRAEFNTEWSNSDRFEGTPQLRIEIETPDYEQNQYAWYPPSDKKGTKWSVFRKALQETGAWKDLEIKGATDVEKLHSLAKSLVGMTFTFEKHMNFPGWGGRIIKNITIPVKYHGRTKLTRPEEVETEKVGLE